MPTGRILVRQKQPSPAPPRLQCSRARSTDPNTHWSERARAPTWYFSSCDPDTGGAGGLPPSTPMSKLCFPPAEAGALIRALLYRRYVMAPTHPNTSRRRLEDLSCVHPNAAGLDIGSEEIVVAVPSNRDAAPVRVYRTFTPDLQALVEWLLACDIETVVMESTGVFWIPIYELLEQHGITPYLVNARHVKTVPGRKSDW